MRALVVEDDAQLNNILQHILKREGYEVDAVFDGEDGYYFALQGEYDVVVFDIMLPKLDGISAVSRLRAEHISTPIVMLTAKCAISDRIEGLDCGADRYLMKPFAPKEFLACLRALLRRQDEVVDDIYTAGDLKLNFQTRTLVGTDDLIQLSNKEFLLMQLFIQNFGQTLSRGQITQHVWGIDVEPKDNSIESYISMLRKKLSFLNSNVSIEVEREVGYKLVAL